MSIRTLRPHPIAFEALEVIVGQTSKAAILEFCPGANVGANINDDLDLRWVMIPTHGGMADLVDGDYILKLGEGHYLKLEPSEIEALYEVVT